jgi:hypothetical protein
LGVCLRIVLFVKQRSTAVIFCFGAEDLKHVTAVQHAQTDTTQTSNKASLLALL